MRDVAEAAGVSLKTVSRVVNAEPGVGGPTVDRVQRAIRDLGFQRNDLARSLRHGQTSATVGLVIGDLANPFYSAIARAAEQVAQANGHLLIAASSEGDERRERELLRTLRMRRVDGLLLVPTGGDHRDLAADQRLGVPVVFLDRPPAGVVADAVLLDNEGGARAAAAHLLAAGHRRFGVVGHREGGFYTTARRLAGFRAALADAGVPLPDRCLRLGLRDAAAAEAATRDLLADPQPPTALFTTNNRNTVGAVRAVRALGARVALVGFDDFELADMLTPPVTVVAHDPAELGRRAAELLFARLRGDRSPARTVTLPARLLPRGSGEVPA
jgi:LacI family transcriptional regulator